MVAKHCPLVTQSAPLALEGTPLELPLDALRCPQDCTQQRELKLKEPLTQKPLPSSSNLSFVLLNQEFII
jgi:hypothetical protein